VFFTRPAPVFVVRFLSSPIAQLAVLALIVYVGACMSLLVALVAAVALVLSIPSREYQAHDDQSPPGKKAKDALTAVGKAAMDAGVVAGAKTAADKLDEVADKAKKDPAPSGADTTSSDGKARFIDYAPF